MPSANLKQVAHQLIDKLPGTTTWDDLMRQIYGRQAIERGLADGGAQPLDLPYTGWCWQKLFFSLPNFFLSLTSMHF